MSLPTPFRHPADALPTGVPTPLPTGFRHPSDGVCSNPPIPPHPSEGDGRGGFWLAPILLSLARSNQLAGQIERANK